MKKWEYKSVMVTVDSANKLGEEGWELVAVTESGHGQPLPLYTFKRQLKEDQELLKEG